MVFRTGALAAAETVVIDPIRIVNATGNVRTLPSDAVKGGARGGASRTAW
jgi:hypothetical protein